MFACLLPDSYLYSVYQVSNKPADMCVDDVDSVLVCRRCRLGSWKSIIDLCERCGVVLSAAIY